MLYVTSWPINPEYFYIYLLEEKFQLNLEKLKSTHLFHPFIFHPLFLRYSPHTTESCKRKTTLDFLIERYIYLPHVSSRSRWKRVIDSEFVSEITCRRERAPVTRGTVGPWWGLQSAGQRERDEEVGNDPTQCSFRTHEQIPSFLDFSGKIGMVKGRLVSNSRRGAGSCAGVAL